MYNPYQYYNPYGVTQPNTNVLPPQQVIQVNGKASVDSIQLAPNSSVLVMDISAPMVWLCISDGVGKVTATGYDIKPHEDPPAVNTNDLEQRIKNIEDFILELEARNEQPHAQTAQPNKSKPSRD